LCVHLEHRFYGKSQPNDLSTKNLRYLTIEESLGDLAEFRQFFHKKRKLTQLNKWVAFGIGYGGTLAAWFRLKYPQLGKFGELLQDKWTRL
jgi:pimeloyl-ACP methyl ester carboxylesterase